VKRRISAGLAAGTVLTLALTGAAPALAGNGHKADSRHQHGTLKTVLAGLDGPRGVDALGHGRTLVTETDGTFSLILEPRQRWGRWHGARHGRAARKIELGQVPTGFAPAIAAGRHGTVWILTGAAGPGAPASANASTLFKWKPGWAEPVAFANIAEYQKSDPDPYDLEDLPEDSNPFGLAALRDGSVLVADAAGNELIRVSKSGRIRTVARLKPREVETPEGLPGAGTSTVAEAVATSVTVGADGYWYIGELRGYPATPGTSEIWRVRPGTTGAVCDPENPRAGACKRYADGLTSIVDLGAGRKGIYAVTLSKMSWLATESPTPIPGAEIGGLFLVGSAKHGSARKHGHGSGQPRITELVPGQLRLPGGVDVAEKPYVVGPVFGPGALAKIS
jgi:hypothetical protein